MPIDNFLRYQKSLAFKELFPLKQNGFCECGCGILLTGRKRKWATNRCSDEMYRQYSIVKGNTFTIREELFKIQEGFCQKCGIKCENNEWHADHIIEVRHGGGGCTIENFQTLCVDCHKEKTKSNFI